MVTNIEWPFTSTAIMIFLKSVPRSPFPGLFTLLFTKCSELAMLVLQKCRMYVRFESIAIWCTVTLSSHSGIMLPSLANTESPES